MQESNHFINIGFELSPAKSRTEREPKCRAYSLKSICTQSPVHVRPDKAYVERKDYDSHCNVPVTFDFKTFSFKPFNLKVSRNRCHFVIRIFIRKLISFFNCILPKIRRNNQIQGSYSPFWAYPFGYPSNSST